MLLRILPAARSPVAPVVRNRVAPVPRSLAPAAHKAPVAPQAEERNYVIVMEAPMIMEHTQPMVLIME